MDRKPLPLQALLLSTLILAGTASAAPAEQASPLAGTGITPNVVSYPTEYNDPLIRLNRAIFAFNDVSYRFVLVPFARGYHHVPAPVRSSIGNFFDNLKTPIPLLNHFIQGEVKQAGVDLLRFGVNTTVGVLGLFDPATHWLELERKDTGFADTLARYDVGYGPYLVLPFAGPSDVRGGGGMLIDSLLNPIDYLLDNPDSTITRIFDNVQEYAPLAPAYLEMRKNSEDLYIFMRNAYLQDLQRDADYQQPQ